MNIHAIVNNNYYTNVIAKYNLKWASKLYYLLKEKDADVFKKFESNIELD